MQQLLSFWSVLDVRRRVVIAAATVAVFALVLGLARMASTPSMALLFAGLEPAAAGEVVRALERQGVVHQIRGDSIWVAGGQRDSLRMALAADGLPANTGGGYELLDNLTGFGTTAQMFDAAHLRAKEGELARTIAASPYIRNARVHIAMPGSQPFRRNQAATASVTVSTMSGQLTAPQAQAIRHLVAAAVAGMSPSDVALIDSVSGLVPLAEEGAHLTGESRAEEMRRSVERLLVARVGPGKAMVELSIDVNTERESITERRFDPQGRVLVSSDSEERSSSSSGAPPGVTVASNLPEGDGAANQGSRSQGNETRERLNFEVSETSRELQRTPGGVRRITVAVLVDGQRAPDGAWSPRSDQELADLRDLVATAIGLDEARGDRIAIKSMQFEALAGAGDTPARSWTAGLDVMSLIQLAVIAVLVLAILIFVVRPLIRDGRALHRPAPLALPPVASAAPAELAALTGELTDEDGLDTTGLVVSASPPDPVERLRRLIAEREAESIEILRSWMDEREETRT